MQIIRVILPLRPTSFQTVTASFNHRQKVAIRSALSPLHSPVTPKFQSALKTEVTPTFQVALKIVGVVAATYSKCFVSAKIALN